MFAEELGWVGFAADIYGAVDNLDDTAIRREQAGLYRGNNTLFYGRIQAAVDLLKEHPDVDSDKIAVIGCKFLCRTASSLLAFNDRLILLINLTRYSRLFWWNWSLDLFLSRCN